MIRLELAGEHTRLHSTLCAACPHGTTGCCASPPGVDWSDIGRIVALGGRDWLLEQIAAGSLRSGERGLLLMRVENQEANAGIWPTKCVFHGPAGCTVTPERRAATCNYYICDDAFALGGEAQGEPAAVAGREAHALLMSLYGRWDQELLAWIRSEWPRGIAWDTPFLEAVGAMYSRMVKRDRAELNRLEDFA